MRFSKIKYNGSEVLLTWTTKLDGAGEIEHTLKSFDTPSPEFVSAFRGLLDPCLDVLELADAGWSQDDVTPIGCSINTEDDGRCGLVVTLKKSLEAANAPLILNTPHLREWKDEEQSKGFIPDALLGALRAVEREASAYVKGKRAQADLFSGGDA